MSCYLSGDTRRLLTLDARPWPRWALTSGLWPHRHATLGTRPVGARQWSLLSWSLVTPDKPSQYTIPASQSKRPPLRLPGAPTAPPRPPRTSALRYWRPGRGRAPHEALRQGPSLPGARKRPLGVIPEARVREGRGVMPGGRRDVTARRPRDRPAGCVGRSAGR